MKQLTSDQEEQRCHLEERDSVINSMKVGEALGKRSLSMPRDLFNSVIIVCHVCNFIDGRTLFVR